MKQIDPSKKRNGIGPGRPSPYAGREVEIATEIAAELSKGTPMTAILAKEGMPSHDAVADWREADPVIERIIARAREEGFDVIAQDCLQIADDGTNDTQEGDDGKAIINHDHIARSRLRVETRLKLLAKWDPKRYGDTASVNTNVNVGVEIPAIQFVMPASFVKRRGK